MGIKLKPVGDRLLVTQEETENKTRSGIYLTESAKTTWFVGKVLAIGDDIKINVKEGDRVMYSSYFTTLEGIGFLVNSGNVYGLVHDVDDTITSTNTEN